MSQLTDLSKPFPASLIEQKNMGRFKAAYVSHSAVNEKLLANLGAFDFEVTQLITEADGSVTGCFARLTCEIDGRATTVTEFGDVEEHTDDQGNDLAGNNGARAKVAASDAFKRCAMRLGVGLHLWSGDSYQLHRVLTSREADAPAIEAEGEHLTPATPIRAAAREE